MEQELRVKVFLVVQVILILLLGVFVVEVVEQEQLDKTLHRFGVVMEA